MSRISQSKLTYIILSETDNIQKNPTPSFNDSGPNPEYCESITSQLGLIMKSKDPAFNIFGGLLTLLFADVMHLSGRRYDFSQNTLLLKAS